MRPSHTSALFAAVLGMKCVHIITVYHRASMSLQGRAFIKDNKIMFRFGLKEVVAPLITTKLLQTSTTISHPHHLATFMYVTST
mmetsp:Transcript_3525/g.6337  ORF Transcript_3525/g.6337 Transcript_3525/m.6337 type:complete len:84 (+) Transcript_3525:763-1014(+)